jgi:predicted RNase H-like HicB family nuclease
MKRNLAAVVKRAGGWWIGWIEEIPGVNCQERTKDELLESLSVTLAEALELNRKEGQEAHVDPLTRGIERLSARWGALIRRMGRTGP